jgi:hypothetical protein
MAYFLEDFQRTKYGTKLEEQYLFESIDSDVAEIRDNCRVVYRINEDGNYYFETLWSSEKKYDSDSIVLLSESCLKEPTVLKANTVFANVLGSKGDSIPDGYNSWRSLIEERNYAHHMAPDYDFEVCCANPKLSGEAPYTAFMPSPGFEKYANELAKCYCNDLLSDGQAVCGGHVILGQSAERSTVGDDIFIVPICQRHNTLRLPGYDVGEGYFMKTRTLTPAVVVKYRIDGALVRKYLDKHPNCRPNDL